MISITKNSLIFIQSGQDRLRSNIGDRSNDVISLFLDNEYDNLTSALNKNDFIFQKTQFSSLFPDVWLFILIIPTKRINMRGNSCK